MRKIEKEIRKNKWVGREEGVDLGEVVGGVNLIKMHCIQFSIKE